MADQPLKSSGFKSGGLPLFSRLASATGKFGDAALFALFAVMGISSEIVVHQFTANPLFIIAAPVIILICYTFTAFIFRRLRLRYDQIGDNCYYLGFLFTLTALSIALYDFRGLQVQIGTIVSNFGVALASTILGVILRVLFSQMREDPIEVEEQSRYELAQASAMLKDELFASVRDMNNFRGVMQQSIAESFEEVNEKSKEAILNAAEELAAAAQSINEEIATRNEQLNERFDRFNDLTQRSVASLEILVESMERVRPPNELINDAFNHSVSSMKQLNEEMQKIYAVSIQQRDATEAAIAASAGGMRDLTANFESLTGPNSPLQRVTVNLDAATKNLGALSNEVSNVSKTLTESVEAHRQSLDAFKSVSAESAGLIETYNVQMAAGLENNREMLAEVEKNLAEMARALVKAVGQ
jgi:hypothetical protein